MRQRILTLAVFAGAAVLALLLALALANALQSRSARHVGRALTLADLTWASAEADGLLVTLTGTAPTEVQRFRAAAAAAKVVGISRVIDAITVEPIKALTPPRFSLELLRNDDGISMIGLVPAEWDSAGLLAAVAELAPEHALTNMIETASFPIPEGWDTAAGFGMAALRLLPRSKISLAADAVRVNAITDSPEQKKRLDGDLRRLAPADMPVAIEISAPRPMIAPFTLRFVIDDDGARFDACSADSERSRARIAIAAHKAGATLSPGCVLGLGAPSPRWPDAAEAVIAALAELGAGSVTISDVDVTLIADTTVDQARFDQVIGELTARLPDVFSLKATLTPRPQAETGNEPIRFTAILGEDGIAQLRGRLTDAAMRGTVDAFARAHFGAARVRVATRLDENLPTDWGRRVLAGLTALAELHDGSVEVEPERLAVRGRTGNPEARGAISRQLSDLLGQGQAFSVDVTYVEKLDPNRALPGPAECLALARGVLDRQQITFAPGSAEVTGQAAAVVADLAEALADCKGIPLEIGGHTDSQGRAETNLRLSQQRAAAVLAALARRGVDTDAMSAQGYGAAEPIADNATEAGRIANRRIAVRLTDPAAPASGAEGGAAAATTAAAGSATGAVPHPPPRPDRAAGDTAAPDAGADSDPPPADAAPTATTDPADGPAGDSTTDPAADPTSDWQPLATAPPLRPQHRPEEAEE